MDEAKKAAGYKAVDDHVRSGMLVGLGTGSTPKFAVERVGQKLNEGKLKDITCIPTSIATQKLAESLKIPLITLDDMAKLKKTQIDVSIDGADAVDPGMCLIKGGGGALLREKMVEIVSKKFICIVDETKLCKGLGPSFPLPVEITKFCHEHTMRVVAALPELSGCLKEAVLRTGDCSNNVSKPGETPAVTDNGNYIVDLHFKKPIANSTKAAEAIKKVVGVVDHGIFEDMTYQVSCADNQLVPSYFCQIHIYTYNNMKFTNMTSRVTSIKIARNSHTHTHTHRPSLPTRTDHAG